MTDTPLISVIMSVFNEEEYIREAIESVLNQTLGDFELLITDDCSTDDTVKIIRDIADDRIRLIQNNVNCGLTVNLNNMLKECRGRFIARMDGDDLCIRDRFEKQTAFLNKNPEVMLISCNSVTFQDGNLVSDISGNSEELKSRMLLRPQLPHPGFMMRRELVEEYGYTYDEHFISAQDYDFASRVAEEYPIGILKEALIKYRNHKGQVSRTGTSKQFLFADETRRRLLKKLGIEFSEQQWDYYHSWVLEQDATSEVFLNNQELLKTLLAANEKVKIYDETVLKDTLWNQYFKWVLRTNGRKKIFNICGINPALYVRALKVGILMCGSKISRRRIYG